jgi:hypothetical protein
MFRLVEIDPVVLWIAGSCLVMFLAGAAAFVFAFKIGAMKVNQEIGLLKNHLKYHPAPPSRHYR